MKPTLRFFGIFALLLSVLFAGIPEAVSAQASPPKKSSEEVMKEVMKDLVPFMNEMFREVLGPGMGISEPSAGGAERKIAYVPPVYDQKEFQYFVEQSDKGDPSKTRTELRQLLLAPKLAVRTSLPEHDVARLKKGLAEALKAKVSSAGAVFPQHDATSFVLELAPDTSQEKIVATLNALAAQSGGAYDVVPVFYVENREAVVSGVTVTFGTPLARRRVEQMLEVYGGFRGLDVQDESGGLRWRITPKPARFAIESTLAKDGKMKRGKFDMHLLLLANLLESQKLLPGVPVISARPTWQFLEEPLSASLSVVWGADTVGGERVLSLSVLIPDHDRVRFDPAKVPFLGSPGFELKVVGADAFVIPGWLKLSEQGVVKDKNGWSIAPASSVTLGGRSFSRYTMTRSFYLLQPEVAFTLGSLAVPYEYWDDAGKRWKREKALTQPLTVAVLPHRLGGSVAMPSVPVSGFPGSVQAFLAPSEVARGENTHWFASWIDRAGRWNISIGTLSIVATALFALAFLSLTLFGVLWNRERAKANAQKPFPMPFLSKEEFTERLSALSGGEHSIDDLFARLARGRSLLEEILVARIPGVNEGGMSLSALKGILLHARGNDEAYVSALTKAIVLLELSNALNAPKGSLDAAYVAEELEAFRNKLPALYDDCSRLPPRMRKGASYADTLLGS